MNRNSLVPALAVQRLRVASLLRAVDQLGGRDLPGPDRIAIGHLAEDLRASDRRLEGLLDRLTADDSTSGIDNATTPR